MQDQLLRAARAVKRDLDRQFGPALQRCRRRGPPDLRPYCGFGAPGQVTVQGRVVRPYGLARGAATDPAWLTSCSVCSAGRSAVWTCRAAQAQATTNPDGFFELHFVLAGPLPQGWAEAEITLPGQLERDTVPMRVVGDAAFGIISDLDDTAVKTGVTRWWQMRDNVLLENARTRLPFAGAGQLYHALVGGSAGQANNPVFYVSSSPWKFYTLLWRFLKKGDVSLDPFFCATGVYGC